MALNKIFIHRRDLSFSEVKESDSDIAFIRKDALLEWAKDMKAETEDVIKQHSEDESLWAEMHWWEVVIAKINAM